MSARDERNFGGEKVRGLIGVKESRYLLLHHRDPLPWVSSTTRSLPAGLRASFTKEVSYSIRLAANRVQTKDPNCGPAAVSALGRKLPSAPRSRSGRCVIHPMFYRRLKIDTARQELMFPFPDHEEFRALVLEAA